MPKVTLYEKLQAAFQRNHLLVAVWMVVIFMSSLTTLVQGMTLIVGFYRNSLAERQTYYQKLQDIVPGVQIAYISEQLGSPAIINSSNDGTKKEYIFINKYYYLQAITRIDGYVLAVAITSRQKDFQPSFSAHGITDDLKLDPIINPIKERRLDGSVYLNDEAYHVIKGSGIVLNKTKFSDITSQKDLKQSGTICRARIGAHRFSYSEEIYLANGGNYQSIILAQNDAGYDGVIIYSEKMFEIFFEGHADDKSCNNVPEEQRTNAAINTLVLTAPFVHGKDIEEFTFGADLQDVSVFD